MPSRRYRQFLHDALHLFYPAVCAGCGSVVEEGRMLCAECERALAFEKEEVDFVPMLQMHGIAQVLCLYHFQHNALSRRLIHNIKYRDQRALARELGRQLGEAIDGSRRFREVDLIVPVPLHPIKARQRGYNQSLELCKGVAERFRRPVCSDNLVRVAHGRSQTQLSDQERQENIDHAFALRRPHEFFGKHILLVDDVLTTGSTLLAAATPVLRLPTARVSAASIAIARMVVPHDESYNLI